MHETLPKTAETASSITEPPVFGATGSPGAARFASRDELLREAEAQRALAELFPHLKLDALRAIQDLFPVHAGATQRGAAASRVH